MFINKEFQAKHTAQTVTDSDLEMIRRFALRPVTADELFAGRMALANDQVDKSHERFPVAYLERFAETLPGKPVLVGHDQKLRPVGKFYDASVIKRGDGSGNDLIARYYLRADNDLARDIELGIASGVSISAYADRRFCGICAKDYDAPGNDRCAHEVGREYDGKMCHLEWGGDAGKVEAIEGSFVANPCQIGAQALARGAEGQFLAKGMGQATPGGNTMEIKEATDKIAALELECAQLTTLAAENEPLVKAGLEYIDFIKGETLRLASLVSEADRAEAEALLASITGPNLILLKTFHAGRQKRFDERYPPRPEGLTKEQLQQSDSVRPFDPVATSPYARRR